MTLSHLEVDHFRDAPNKKTTTAGQFRLGLIRVPMREDYDNPSDWSLQDAAELYRVDTVVIIWTADDERQAT